MKAVLSATATSSVATTWPRCSVDQGVALRERLRHRADRQARSRASRDRTARARTCRRRTRGARRSTSREQRAGVLGARLRGGVGRARQRLGVAHQRAQIGVFPFLDAPMRQAGRGEALERGRAQRRRARQLAPSPPAIRPRAAARRRSSSGSVQPLSYSAATGAPGTARSRSPRARAPAPCRRSSRCGPSTARARCPARCSRAGADSA